MLHVSLQTCLDYGILLSNSVILLDLTHHKQLLQCCLMYTETKKLIHTQNTTQSSNTTTFMNFKPLQSNKYFHNPILHFCIFPLHIQSMVHDIHIKSYLMIFLKMHRVHSTECYSCDLEIIANITNFKSILSTFGWMDGLRKTKKISLDIKTMC